MDCSQFTRFCFLILTIVALCPNIAMPSDNYAEGTQGSSSGKTSVTVYHCKDCKSNICESSNYEGFVKIGETQSQTFSNEIIQLVASETQISMCLQQENTVPKGIYAIVWEKAMGTGDSCGDTSNALETKILMDKACAPLQASSENVMSNTTKICCEVETDPSATEHPLKCYTAIFSYRQTRDLCLKQINSTYPLLATVSGDHNFSAYKENKIGIVVPLLILGLCAAALAIYCVQRNRKCQGPVIVLHQSFNGFGKLKGSPDVENPACF